MVVKTRLTSSARTSGAVATPGRSSDRRDMEIVSKVAAEPEASDDARSTGPCSFVFGVGLAVWVIGCTCCFVGSLLSLRVRAGAHG